MIDHRRDYDENDEAHDHYRRIVELMRIRGKLNRQETCVQFGLILAAVLFGCAVILAVM